MSKKVSKDYTFYAGFLRFVAQKTDKTDPSVHAMMAELNQAADQIDHASRFQLLASRAQASSRAFAGVAQFLQHRILPEAQSHGNPVALAQIEWAIAASLQVGRAVILHLDEIEEADMNSRFIEITLPPLDRIAGQQNSDQPDEKDTPSSLH